TLFPYTTLFRSVPGFATRIARPHQHGARSFTRIRGGVIRAFSAAGVTPALAEQSWYIFGTSVVSWLAAMENPLELGEAEPRLGLFLDVLLRGLPAQEPAPGRPGALPT